MTTICLGVKLLAGASLRRVDVTCLRFMGGAWEWFGHGRLNYAMIYSSLEWKFTHYYWWREGKAARQFRNGWQQIRRLENFGWWAARPPSVVVVTIAFAVVFPYFPHNFSFSSWIPVPCPFHRSHTPKDFYVSKVISCNPLEVRSWGAAGDAEATDPIRRVPVDHVFVG